ncbi:MAG: hypothetical protein ACYS76_01255 [Planctomycetota bacterium]
MAGHVLWASTLIGIIVGVRTMMDGWAIAGTKGFTLSSRDALSSGGLSVCKR